MFIKKGERMGCGKCGTKKSKKGKKKKSS